MYTFLENVCNYVILMHMFFKKYTQFYIFNIHNISKNVHNFYTFNISVHNLSKNVRNSINLRYPF